MKDPALLFYTANFVTETRRMSFEQIGKYIKLICFQHQTGHIIEDEFFEIVSETDTPILALYEVDEEGKYYVPHIDDAIDQRRRYSISRAENAKKKKKKPDEDAQPNF